MDIFVNGVPVARVEGFTRTVAIRNTAGGEITNFSTAPDVPGINIITEQKLPANAPRLDEVEALEYLAALERGDYGPQEGQDDDISLAEQNTIRITESDVDIVEDDETPETEENPDTPEAEEEEENKPSAFNVGGTTS